MERFGRFVIGNGHTASHGCDVDEAGVFEQAQVSQCGTTQGVVYMLVDGFVSVTRTVERSGGVVESGRRGLCDRDGHFQRHVEIEVVIQIVGCRVFFGLFCFFRR